MAPTTERFFPREEVSEAKFFPREEIKDSFTSFDPEDTGEGFWKSAFKYGMGIATLVPQAIGEVMSQPGRALGMGGGIWEEVSREGKEAEKYWVEHQATRPSIFVKGLPDRMRAFVGYIAGGEEMAKPYVDALNKLQGIEEPEEMTLEKFQALPQEKKDKIYVEMAKIKTAQTEYKGMKEIEQQSFIGKLVRMRREMTSSDETDEEYAKDLKKAADYILSFPEIILNTLTHTPATLVAQGLGAVGMDKLSKDIHMKAAIWQELLSGKDKPDFAQRLTQGLSSIGTFYFIGWGATSAIGAVKILSPTAKLGSMVGTMTAAESSIQAGSVWQQVYLETGDEKKANEAGKRVFLLNVGMIGLTLRYGLLNPKLKGVYGNLIAGLPEGFQESVQSDIDKMSVGKPISSEESLDDAIIGYLSSVIFKGAMDARSHYRKKNAPEVDKVMKVLEEVEKLGQEQAQIIKKDIQEKIAESEDVERIRNVFERKGVKPVNMEELQGMVEEGRYYSKKKMVKEFGLEPKQITLLRDEGHVKYEKGKGWIFPVKTSASVAVENEEKISAFQKQIDEALVLSEEIDSVEEVGEVKESPQVQPEFKPESKPEIDPETGIWSMEKMDRELSRVREEVEILKAVNEDIENYVRGKKHIKLGEYKETEKVPLEASSLAKGVEIPQEKLAPKSITELAREVKDGQKEQDSLTSLVELIEKGDLVAIEKSLKYLEGLKKVGTLKSAYDLQFERVVPAAIEKVSVIKRVKGKEEVKKPELKIEVKKDYGVRKRIDLAQKKLEKVEAKKEHKAEVAELKKKRKDVTLESGGLQTIYKNLMEKAGVPETAQNDLFELGKYVYSEGATQAKVWAEKMKESLGKMWDSYKKFMGQTWKKVKEFNEKLGERGEVSIEEFENIAYKWKDGWEGLKQIVEFKKQNEVENLPPDVVRRMYASKEGSLLADDYHVQKFMNRILRYSRIDAEDNNRLDTWSPEQAVNDYYKNTALLGGHKIFTEKETWRDVLIRVTYGKEGKPNLEEINEVEDVHPFLQRNMDEMDKRIQDLKDAFVKKKRNAKTAKNFLEDMKTRHVNEDALEESETALEEYNDVLREDYADAEEYQDEKDEAWETFVDSLDNLEVDADAFNEFLFKTRPLDMLRKIYSEEEIYAEKNQKKKKEDDKTVTLESSEMPVPPKDTHYEKFAEKMREEGKKVKGKILETNEYTQIEKLLARFPEPYIQKDKYRNSLKQWVEYFNRHLDPKIYNLRMLNYILDDPNFSKQMEKITFIIEPVAEETPTSLIYYHRTQTVEIKFLPSQRLEYVLEAIIEEVTHSLTLHKMAENKELNDKVTKLKEAFVRSLPLSHQIAINLINQDIERIKTGTSRRVSLSSLIKQRKFGPGYVSFDFYHSIYRGTINSEFIVGAWSDKELRNKLANIPYQSENKSLLQKIQETIKEFVFGVPPTQQWTLLDEVFSLTEEIARAPYSSFVGDFKTYNAPEAQMKQDKESIKKEKDSSIYSPLVRVGIQNYKDGATSFQEWSKEMKKISDKIPDKLLQRVYNSVVGITKTSEVSFDAESKYGDPNKPVAWYKVKGKKEKQEFRTHKGNPRLPITESLANMINLMNKDVSGAQTYVFRNILKKVDSTFGTDFLNVVFKTPIIPTRDVKVGFMEVSKNAFRWIDDTYKTDFLNVIFRPGEEATKNARLIVLSRSGEINDIMKKHGLSYKNLENIMSYAIVQQEGGVEALERTKQPVVESLSKQEQELYDKMVKYLESDYIRFNEARMIAGKHPIKKVENYFTWQRIVESYYENGVDPITIDVSDFIKGFETKMPNAKNRVTGAMKPFEMNVVKVFHDYQTSVQRYIHLTPVLSKMREMLSFMKEVGISSNSPKVYTYLNDWTNYEAGIQKNEFLGSHVLAMIINKLTRNIADAVMVANMKVFLTQFSSFDAVVGEVGLINFQKGLRDFMDEKKRKFVEETSRVAMIRVPETALMDSFMEIVYNYSKSGMSLKDQALAIHNASRRYGYKHIQISDYFVAKVTWLAAYNKAKNENKSPKEVLNYADDILLSTQGSAASIHLSPLQKTVLGRAMSLFGTFVINRYGWLKHGIVLPIVKGKHIDRTRKEAFKKLIIYYFMAGAIDWFFEELLGVNSPNPTPAKSAIISYNKDEKLFKALIVGFEGLLGNLPIIGSSTRYGGSPFGPVPSYIVDVLKWVGKEAGYHKGYTPSAQELIAKGVGVQGTQQVKTMYTGLDKDKSPIQVIFGGRKREPGILGELMD